MQKILSFLVTISLLVTFVTKVTGQSTSSKNYRIRNGLPNTFLKLKKRQPLNIAYLGGSITAAKDGWRDQSLAWLKKEYGNEAITGINAGLPGTGSDLGAFRVGPQVLVLNPDLVFIEFAVNDGSKPKKLIHQTMEGIVRQIRRHNKKTEICFVYTIAMEMLPNMQKGKLPSSAAAMEEVADYYGIPSITFGFTVANEVSLGKMVFKGKKEDFPTQMVFSPDGVHPYTDTGQKVYAEVLGSSLKSIFQQTSIKTTKYKLKVPNDPKNWENATLKPISPEMKRGNWKMDSFKGDELRSSLITLMGGVSKADKPGSSLIVKFKGTTIGLMDIIGPGSGSCDVIVDGKLTEEKIRFDKYCTTYRLHYFILPELPMGEHTVEFRVSSKKLDKLNILNQLDTNTIPENMKDYEEHTGFALGLLLNGHLLKN